MDEVVAELEVEEAAVALEARGQGVGAVISHPVPRQLERREAVVPLQA